MTHPNKNTLLLLFLAYLVSFPLKAQQGYNIELEVNGLKDTTAYLGYYFGESTYIKDTTEIDSKGRLTFSNKKSLPQGIYFLVTGKTKLFEFAMDKDQSFHLKTDTSSYIENMKIKGSPGSELFLDNMIFNLHNNKAALPHITVLKDSTASEEEKQKARAAFNVIDKKVKSHQDEIIKSHPDALISRILKANREIEVPNNPNGEKEDPLFALRYYRNHFWDDFDLKDPSMIRLSSPLYKEKLDLFLDKLYPQHPDTLKQVIDKLASTAKQNQDTYKYFIWGLTMKYQNPKTMGLDALFVHLYDRYFANGEMDYWANEKLIENIKERADRMRKCLIGLSAPNLIMQDIHQEPKSIYDIRKKYTVIYFFDPDCGFCRKETPKLKKFYDSKRFDVEVFAVSADTSMTKMKDYIEEYDLDWITVNGPRTYTVNYHDVYDAITTPTIYILDERKKIIGKKLGAERLDEFLTQYEKSNNENE